MNAWLEFGLSNGVAASLLALVAALATRFCRRPQVVLVLWLLVLAKLLAPPIVGLPAVSLRAYLPTAQNVVPVDAAAFDTPDDIEMAQPGETVVELPNESLLAAEREFDQLASLEQLHATDSLPAIDLHSPSADSPPLAAQHEMPTADAALVPSLSTWLPRAVFWIWITGSALWFAIAAARIARFARLIRHAEPADTGLQDEVRQLAEQMGVSRVPDVRVARRRVPPLVWGMSGRPTLLLPAELLENLSDQQRATLLAHELAHVARRDDLVRWFELAAIGLYWWHPVAWWARYNAEAAQEQCCDARVISLLPHAARAYAETLLATIEFLAEPGRKVPLGASGFSQVGHMHRRMTMILKRNTTGRMSWTMTASLAALSLFVLPVSLHTLWAEPVAESEVEVTVDADVSDAADVTDAAEVELFAEASEPEAKTEDVEVEEGADDEPKVEVAEAVAEPAEDNDEIDPAIEQRLDRLEKMIEKLAGRATESDKKAGKPAAAETKPASKSEKGQHAHIKPLQDSALEFDHNWADLVREATMTLELTKTNVNRLEAARRQLEAVVEAYEHDTVTAEQVSEAIRRRGEACTAYSRTVSDLAREPARRDYLIALGWWISAGEAARDTKKIWAAAAERGRPNEELDQFKEQYSTFVDSAKKAQSDLKKIAALPAGAADTTRRAALKFLIANAGEGALAKDDQRQVVDQKEQIMRAKIEAQQRESAAMQRHFKLNFEKDQRIMAELAAKRAAIEGEIAKTAAMLEARQKELMALEAAQAYDAAKLKGRELAVEKLKAVKEQLLEKPEKEKDRDDPNEPDDEKD